MWKVTGCKNAIDGITSKHIDRHGDTAISNIVSHWHRYVFSITEHVIAPPMIVTKIEILRFQTSSLNGRNVFSIHQDM